MSWRVGASSSRPRMRWSWRAPCKVVECRHLHKAWDCTRLCAEGDVVAEKWSVSCSYYDVS
eukprot:54132-Eustigmatos_ZCMA.PRE.1